MVGSVPVSLIASFQTRLAYCVVMGVKSWKWKRGWLLDTCGKVWNNADIKVQRQTFGSAALGICWYRSDATCWDDFDHLFLIITVSDVICTSDLSNILSESNSFWTYGKRLACLMLVVNIRRIAVDNWRPCLRGAMAQSIFLTMSMEAGGRWNVSVRLFLDMEKRRDETCWWWKESVLIWRRWRRALSDATVDRTEAEVLRYWAKYSMYTIARRYEGSLKSYPNQRATLIYL